MIGKTLSHYKILEQLGAGGMGVVYRAHDERLGRDVALKLLPAEQLGSETARRALENEARTASALNHPHICTIHDVGEAEGQFFVAMEYVEGKPLAQLIPAGGLPEEQMMRYGMQIADALAHAEQRGIVHRDLKSANVMVTPEGRTKVLDFGLAQRARKEELEEVTKSKVSLPAAGGIAGTLAYMAPEALCGEAADARSDIWALGVVLHEMAAGELPFQGATGFELSSAILREPPAALAAHVSAGLRAVIQRCLAKDPVQRYQRAGEVRAALEAIGSSTHAALETAGTAPVVAAPEKEAHKTFWRSATFGSAGVLALAALLLAFNVGGARDRLLGRATPSRIESLAVLPLENFSRDPEQDYFADGMTEALTTDLAQIGALRVISRTSVMQYKGTHKPLPEIAKELRVDAVVEGSVQRVGNRVKITAQLIRAATDTHLWAKDYDRDLRDVLSMQSEVARAIANEIKIELTPNEKERLGKEHQVNPEAHDLYLRGRFALSRATDVKGIWKSIELFQQALAIDPNSALAYAGLADAYESFGDNYLPPKETMPKGKMAAEKALALDETLAEAHNALAYVNFVFDWDFPAAEKQVRRALELNPNYAPAHDTYAAYLTALGRFTEADRESQRAVELDPFAVSLAVGRGWYLVAARQYDRAIELLRKTVDLEPNCGGCRAQLALALAFKGEFPAAIEEGRKGVQLDNSPLNLAFLCSTYALAGKTAETRQTIAQLKGMSKTQFVCPYEIGVAYLHLGETDEAFRWLDRGYEQHSYCMVWLKVDQRWDLARNDARFQALLRRMNLPQ